MEVFDLNAFVKGWFIGNFSPSLFNTNDVEVAVKKYKQGDYEHAHYHKIATEFTVIISGSVEMNGKTYSENDIVKITPNAVTDFRAVTDAITVVVKMPGANNDKYEAD